MLLPKTKVKQTLESCKAMVEELKIKCAECLTELNNMNELHTAKLVNAITAIKTTIE